MMTQKLIKKKKEIKFGRVFIRKRQKRCTEKVREEDIEDRKLQQEGKQKGIVLVLWPNSLEQLSS